MKINKYSPELRYLKYLHQNKHQKFGWGHWRWDPYNYDQGAPYKRGAKYKWSLAKR